MFSSRKSIGARIFNWLAALGLVAGVLCADVSPTWARKVSPEDDGPIIQPGDGEGIGGYKEPQKYEADGELQQDRRVVGLIVWRDANSKSVYCWIVPPLLIVVHVGGF